MGWREYMKISKKKSYKNSTAFAVLFLCTQKYVHNIYNYQMRILIKEPPKY